MFLEAANKLLNPLGYEVRKPKAKNSAAANGSLRYVLHSYKRLDGTFDYEHYRQTQEQGNKEKIENVWVEEENIIFLSNYLKKKLSPVSKGICHGTRRGKEQEWFRKYLGADVIGTEISETATQFPHTIQWDFHEVKPEWIDSMDFIYSNSFDQSYDPEKCLNAWMSCVRPNGFCVIEHSNAHGPEGADELDPFGADIAIMPYLIATWGKGKYGVREILEAPKKDVRLDYLSFIVIQRF